MVFFRFRWCGVISPKSGLALCGLNLVHFIREKRERVNEREDNERERERSRENK